MTPDHACFAAHELPVGWDDSGLYGEGPGWYVSYYKWGDREEERILFCPFCGNELPGVPLDPPAPKGAKR